jgi:hypothetical protein
VLRRGARCRLALGEGHYRRTEVSWRDAGSPTADVVLEWTGGELRVGVDVTKRDEPIFVSRDAVNRYDNEWPDVNGDGIQLYVFTATARGGWTIVPELDGGLRVRPVAGWGSAAAPWGSWRRTDGGYQVDLALPLELPGAERGTTIELDVLVNEMASGRERRQGQLVMSGAAGEFAYLAGDRHDPTRLLQVRLEP